MVMKRAGGDGRGSLAGISGSPWLGGIEFSGDGTKKAFGTRASKEDHGNNLGGLSGSGFAATHFDRDVGSIYC
jgi:hypothetical protein